MQFSTVIFFQNREIDALRHEIEERFQTHQAVAQWDLHITIGSGVTLDEKQLKQASTELKLVARRFKPFEVQLKDFGFMDDFRGEVDNPYLVYIDVVTNTSLRELHHAVETVLQKYPRWYEIKKYVPHLTLAYDDLTQQNYEAAKKFLNRKKASFAFTVDSFSFALHGGRYEERKRYVEFKLGV